MRRRAWAAFVTVLAAIVLGATASPAVGGSSEAMKALGILEPRTPTPAPDVTLPTLGGPPLALRSLRGKVVLVNFWATWCVPCQWEMPLMEKLYQAYKGRGFVVAAISLDQQGAVAVEPFVRQNRLTYPILLDPTLQGARQFGIRGLPATFLIGTDGYVKGVTYGPREWDGPEARALIESLLLAGRDPKG